jgi:hypothetical protein
MPKRIQARDPSRHSYIIFIVALFSKAKNGKHPMCVDGRMHKQNVLYTCKEILFNPEKE